MFSLPLRAYDRALEEKHAPPPICFDPEDQVAAGQRDSEDQPGAGQSRETAAEPCVRVFRGRRRRTGPHQRSGQAGLPPVFEISPGLHSKVDYGCRTAMAFSHNVSLPEMTN